MSKNAYICDKLHAIVTVNVDEGTTPMFISCPVCGGHAVSRMGRVDSSLEAAYEWYRPCEADIIQEAKNMAVLTGMPNSLFIEALKEHAIQGGLLLRKIENNADTKQ